MTLRLTPKQRDLLVLDPMTRNDSWFGGLRGRTIHTEQLPAAVGEQASRVDVYQADNANVVDLRNVLILHLSATTTDAAANFSRVRSSRFDMVVGTADLADIVTALPWRARRSTRVRRVPRPGSAGTGALAQA